MNRKEKRKQQKEKARERARQAALDTMPEFKPLSQQEILKEFKEFKLLTDFKYLIKEIKDAMYHKPSQTYTEINKPKLTTKPLQTTIINVKSIGST